MQARRTLLGAAALAAMTATAVLPARAQPPGGRSPERVEEALEALLIVTLKRDLGLETTAAVELAGKARVLLEGRRDFARQQARLRRELLDAVQSAAPDPQHLDRLIQSVFELRARFAAEQQRLFQQLSAELPPVQRAKLFASLEMFEERVRRHLRRAEDGGRRRDRRGGDDGAADDGF